ncbi:cysteine dioxygenase [Minwuia sp.]|uniref:cysteine dioxygenase family protein n=1 Tax=Minwuia sp. TaxID=2493630 RepID=UPI003A9562AF
MEATERSAARKREIAEAVMRIRAIETAQGVTRTSLNDIKAVLLELAERKDLFPLEDFTHPGGGPAVENALFRLHEDDDHRFALYGQMSTRPRDTPAHNHTTWAIVVGMYGEELNKFYDRDNGGVAYRDEHVVKAGTGVAMLPDDLHSIHMHAREPVLNFHMYGLALEQLDRRQYYRPETNDWKHFPASEGIQDLPEPA